MNQQSIKREREKNFIDVYNPQTDPDDSLGKNSDKKYALMGIKLSLQDFNLTKEGNIGGALRLVVNGRKLRLGTPVLKDKKA